MNSYEWRMLDPAERFKLSQEAREGSDCRWFTGPLSKQGYGRFMIKRKKHLAHRWAYEQQVGEIPEGLVVRHKCDNPSCVNIDHLELGTHKDNTLDAITRGRRGTKITAEDVVKIRNMPNKEAMSLYGLSSGYVCNIKKGRARGHVQWN